MLETAICYIEPKKLISEFIRVHFLFNLSLPSLHVPTKKRPNTESPHLGAFYWL